MISGWFWFGFQPSMKAIKGASSPSASHLILSLPGKKVLLDNSSSFEFFQQLAGKKNSLNNYEEVLKMEDLKIRQLLSFEVLEILREEGIVFNDVIMDGQRFIKRCHLLGFHPNKVWKAIKPF